VIRAFIAIEIDAEIVRAIARAITGLKSHLPGVRWVPETNIHLTLKFLSDIEEGKIAPIAEALRRALHPFSCFAINAKGLGVFPGVSRPRVLWVGLAAAQLRSLATAIETALEPIGFERETKAFKPHLTVGRWRRFDGSSKVLGQEIERWREFDFGRFEVHEVVLFRSVLLPDGALYTPLEVAALAKSLALK